jgi:flagellin-specific chaperone FliS
MKTVIDPRQMYQDSAARGAMRRALEAIKRSEIEVRSAAVGHALMVLQQLQGTLDFEHGGSAAKQFEQFYNLIRAKLLEAQMRSSPDLMEQQIRFMSEVRDCWIQAKRILQPGPHPATAAQGESSEEGGYKSEWDA